MKRMIYVWVLLILVVFGIGIVREDWSLFVNGWALIILTLLVLLLCIEIGLYFWRRRMLHLSRLTKDSQIRMAHTEQEDYDVPPTNST